MTGNVPQAAHDIVTFWLEAGPDKWFDKDAQFDATFHARFRDLHFSAARQDLADWLDTPAGSLALLLLLDQFPRNCFRGTAHMYATDYLARHYARIALDRRWDGAGAEALRIFFYLPFMHSEALDDQDLCCRLCEPLGPDLLKHAVEHRDIIVRFGRFPHRNAILLRQSTTQEQSFLNHGGFSG